MARHPSSEAPSATPRRTFMKQGLTALAGVTVVPRRVLGGPGRVAPSDKVTAACIGVGSQGTRVMLDFLRQEQLQVVAVCDVNEGSDSYEDWSPGELNGKVRNLLGDESWASWGGPLAGMAPARTIVERYYAGQRDAASYSGCSAHVDYRELLAQASDLDAVIVCTPDHVHAAVSIAAMHSGRHVFCQKPMTHTVYEARRMAEVAQETGAATQVATGNSASEATRLLTEWIDAGVIGPVREVHNWSSRPFWPQGIDRPAEEQPVPSYLHWDLWLGPAPERPFNEIYQPFVWRGWYDFGTGAIGDMGCYSFDTIFRALHLGAPERVEASSTLLFKETYPTASLIRLHFPERDAGPPVTLHWYDGGLKPRKPDELGDDDLDVEGLLFVGDRGKILCGFNGSRPRLIPQSAMDAFEPPPKTLPRSIGHYEEWIAACQGGEAPAANFGFAGGVTEAILLGNVAVRRGRSLTWDSQAMRVTNDPEANDLLRMPYRNGWTLS